MLGPLCGGCTLVGTSFRSAPCFSSRSPQAHSSDCAFVGACCPSHSTAWPLLERSLWNGSRAWQAGDSAPAVHPVPSASRRQVSVSVGKWWPPVQLSPAATNVATRPRDTGAEPLGAQKRPAEHRGAVECLVPPAGRSSRRCGESSVPATAASVDEPAETIEQPRVPYPPALAEAGIPGRVELEYVVDTLGCAEPGSLGTAGQGGSGAGNGTPPRDLLRGSPAPCPLPPSRSAPLPRYRPPFPPRPRDASAIPAPITANPSRVFPRFSLALV